MTMNRATTAVASPRSRVPRKIEIASNGPNSPIAPTALIEAPNGVCISPASRRIGMIVPSAVDERAIAMITAVSPGATIHPIPNPTSRLISQPDAARRPPRPRNACTWISFPARKKSIARPRSASVDVNSDGSAHPSRLGPTTMPSSSSKTTMGMRTHRERPRAMSGANTASAGITKRMLAISLPGQRPNQLAASA